MSTTRTIAEQFIAPERVYPRASFLAITGLGLSTVRKYRRAGIELKTLEIGQQVLVRGADGIRWLEQIAEHQRRATEDAAWDNTCEAFGKAVAG